MFDLLEKLRAELVIAEKKRQDHFKDNRFNYWDGVCDGIESCIAILEKS